jgi:hypothetical protein
MLLALVSSVLIRAAISLPGRKHSWNRLRHTLLLWASRAATPLSQAYTVDLHMGHTSMATRLPGLTLPACLPALVLPVHLLDSVSLATSSSVASQLPPPWAVWDQNALAAMFNTTSLTPPPSVEWYMDSGADNHMTSTSGNLLSSQPPLVGNGSLLPVTSTGHTFFPTPNHPLHLSHILMSPHIIKNYIFVCQFTTDNQVFVEFDMYGLSVKDLHMRNMIVRCNSSGRLYPLFSPTSSLSLALLVGASPSTLWHRWFGHLSFEALSRLVPSCNKT